MNIYIDESIHNDHGFMLLSFVICKHDPQEDLQKLLQEYGLEEFHACTKMKNNKAMQEIRSKVRNYINWNSKWGVFVLPSDLRHEIFDDFARFISNLEKVYPDETLNIFVDEGIVNNEEANDITENQEHVEIDISDSSKVNGIQLADLVAALCGVRLREEISRKPKMLTYGNEAGFDPPIEADLGYELWASLRYSMLNSNVPNGENEMPDMATFSTKGYGFFLSEQAPESLCDKANMLFSEVYLGCIH